MHVNKDGYWAYRGKGERGRERERECSQAYPKADHLINKGVVGRAECLRVVRDPYARQKERERERGHATASAVVG